ncbi:MAG TPA: alpha/beta hydrolase [Planctomycetota bacterium]|jgi:pimeloyl-ACP methyl ester carboxylesterase|nr:alpha/beta hydrolase [Planctomycetota bacterium]
MNARTSRIVGSLAALLTSTACRTPRASGADAPVLPHEVAGNGDPVVLIHGGRMDRRMWDGQFGVFAREFRVARYDVRGFGESEPARAPYSDAEDLLRLLDALEVGRAHLVGLSLGAGIALDFAILHPDRVGSLVLVGPGLAGVPTSAEEEDSFRRFIEAAQRGPDEAVDVWLRDAYMVPSTEEPARAARIRRIVRENAKAFLMNPFLRRRLRPPADERLSEVRVPTLLVVGDRDREGIRASVERLASAVAGAEKIVIPGAGHIVNMEKPEEFDRAVLDFLRRRARGKNR